jgi:hypothetical protein
MKTQVTIKELTKEDLVDLFSTAFYGSNYLSADYEEAIEYNEEDCYEEIMANILLNGGKIFVTDGYADGCHYGNLQYQFNEDYDATYTLRLEDIIKGLEKAANGTFNLRQDVGADYADRNREFAKRSFEAMAWNINEWDAITADCLMQIILFDEIIYG